MKDLWKLSMGANFTDEGVMFRVWAPKAKKVGVKIGKDLFTMLQRENGIYEICVKNLKPGVDYTYILNDEKERPDPVSRFQPYGVHKSSRVMDSSDYDWKDQNWHGIDLKNYIIYEVHVGTFTEEGTFEALIDKLPYLKELGITAIELMPVVEFPGNRNWGYDGTHIYSPHSSYGGPEKLKKLIDACHQNKIAVVLDVVYNHLGPEGNYLQDFGFYFTDQYKTPWGQAINFDGEHSNFVRQYFIDNALYWLTEFHVDAVRLDAVHSIFDFSVKHVLEELSERFHEQAQHLNRRAYVIAESDLNDVRLIKPQEACGLGIDAQWNDDFHHALHALLTGKRNSYFVDFGSVKDVQKSIKNGFVFEGKWSNYRKKNFGSSSAKLSGEQFVIYLQNHDQIANACEGKRLSSLIEVEKYKLAHMLLLCAPNIPLIFMGQEFASSTPFFYFTSHTDPELVNKIRGAYFQEHNTRGFEVQKHDPQNEETFLSSKIKWSELSEQAQKIFFDFTKELIALRKAHPSLSNCLKNLTSTEINGDELILHRKDPDGDSSLLICNLSNHQKQISVKIPPGIWKPLLASHEEGNKIEIDGKEKQTSIVLPRWSGVLYGKVGE